MKKYTWILRDVGRDRIIIVKAKNAQQAFSKMRNIRMDAQDVDRSYSNFNFDKGNNPRDYAILLISIEEL